MTETLPTVTETLTKACCKGCQREIGMHTDTVFYIKAIHFITPFVTYCNYCSTRFRWRPLPQGIDKEK